MDSKFVLKAYRKMPRKAKRKINAMTVTFQAEHVLHKKIEETQKTFQKLSLDNSRCSFLRTAGNRKYDKPDTPYVRVGIADHHVHKNVTRTGNPLVSTRQNGLTSKVEQAKPTYSDKNTKNVRTHQRWDQGYGKSSGAKVHAAAAKTTISPLRRNRFYELRENTPEREERQKQTQFQQTLLPKKMKEGRPKETKPIVNGLWWNPKNTFDIESPRNLENDLNNNENMGNAKATSLFGTHVGTDGTRSRIGNWRSNLDPNPFWEQKSQQFAESAPQRNYPPIAMPITHLEEFPEQITVSGTEKIAPLRNLGDPGRDIWVSKADHANFNHVRCVKILPQHHQCNGRERFLTPNDLDVEDVVYKLERHRRSPKPGTKNMSCICFRKTRNAYCTVCKSNIIGRAFRRCRQHPEIGFLTDHYYCPFCLAEPSALKDV